MNRFKYLIKNTAIFGISQFTSKVMVFLLLPLYTSYMTTQEYGSADLVISTINLVLPIFTMQIIDAVMRFSMEKKNRAKECLVIGCIVITIGFCVLLLGLPLFRYFHIFNEYLELFYLLYLLNALYSMFSYYARALEKIGLVGIAGVANTLIVVGANCILLIVMRKGVEGYLVSYILGYIVGMVVLLIALRKELPHFKAKINFPLAKEMISYSFPLVPNSMSWWGVTSANKYIINANLSSQILGLYSVALKVPTIINTIQSIIAEALVLSVYKEYDSKSREDEYFSLLYNIYQYTLVIITGGIILGSKMCSKFMFAKEFYDAWVFVPLLCVPSIWGALSGYLGTFYAASKKNNGIFYSTALGGIVTIFFSVATVKKYGIFAIIIGNVISYFVIWLYRWIDVKKYVTIKTNVFRDFFSWGILIVQAWCVMKIHNPIAMYCMNVFFIILNIIVNRKMTIFFIGKMKVILQSLVQH